ncbi:Rab geranylgeranyltransferase [Blyttiomyces sp. JEL0837]|nr:Rab geranylgeranyltransferase [Blyttiomyces sp. JEL0837]
MADGIHGRKRGSVDRSEKARLREKEKVDEYLDLIGKFNAKRNAKELDGDSFAVTTSILSINADHYTAWNVRRQILVKDWADMSTDDKAAGAKQELRFVEELVRKHPKSYWLWNHRGWVLDNMDSPDWARELKLCNMMLDLDARNCKFVDFKVEVENLDFGLNVLRGYFLFSPWMGLSSLRGLKGGNSQRRERNQFHDEQNQPKLFELLCMALSQQVNTQIIKVWKACAADFR